MKRVIKYLLIVTLVLLSGFSFVMCDIDNNNNGNGNSNDNTGKWIIIDNTGLVSSTDGVNWISHSRPSVGINYGSIAYGGGKWNIISNTGLVSSTDGVNWIPHSRPSVGINYGSIAYGK